MDGDTIDDITARLVSYDVSGGFMVVTLDNGQIWRQVTGARSFVTGGTSNGEIWGSDPYQIVPELGKESHESCCTYNMLKLTRHLMSWDPKPGYADYYERALWNGILPTQDPATAMMMYYVPMMPGMFKTFMTPFDSFWCCTGTGMENHAKYGDSIYFHDQDGVYINLFIASTLAWPEKGFGLKQETKFPEEGGTTLIVTAAKSGELALHIRIPYWVQKGGAVKVNGKTEEAFADPSSYLVLKRAWKKGDRIQVVLPMGLHIERTPDDPDTIAILYGPIVLAGDLGPIGLPDNKVIGPMGPEGDPISVPKLTLKDADPEAWIKPVAGKPLTFRTNGIGDPGDVTLVPFYRLFGRRYTVYWRLASAGN